MDVRVSIYGYEVDLHEKTYPLIEDVFVYEKNKIVKVDLKLSKQVSCIFDDIGYDDVGHHISLQFYQWYQDKTPVKDIDVLEMDNTDHLVRVSTYIKLYTKDKYYAIIDHVPSKAKSIALVPQTAIDFKFNSADVIHYNSRVK